MLILYNPPSSARRKPVMPLSLLALGALLRARQAVVVGDNRPFIGCLITLDTEALDFWKREHGWWFTIQRR